MCYGIGCKYENHMGECRKPSSKECPMTQEICDCCGGYFWEDELVEAVYKKSGLPAIVCEECSSDEDVFKGLR
jgi:hypothetical protein